MSRLVCKVKHFILLNYLTLYYFQEIVDQYRVYYDRDKFARIYQNVGRYCLFQYRKIFSEKDSLVPLTSQAMDQYSVRINKNPVHLRFLKYFFLLWSLRSFSVIFLKYFTKTEERRVWIGTEFLKKDGVYIETCVLFWSCISYLFFQFTLTTSLLDYKFMAIFRISIKNSNYLHPSQFGLKDDEFHRLRKFRNAAMFYYNSLMGSLPPFACVALFFLHCKGGLYQSHPIVSSIWSMVIFVWVYFVCSVIYSNLVAFIVVAKYIHIKQKSISTSINKCLVHMRWNRIKVLKYDQILWKQFIEQNIRYSHLQDELQDYNYFWSSYLSFIFVFYVLLISCIIYVGLFGQAAAYLNAVFYLIFNFHVFLLSVLIYYCGSIVSRNDKLAFSFASLVGQFVNSYCRLSTVQYIKIHNISQYQNEISQSSFHLLNGYVITHDTFRLLIANITMYFILIIKR